MPRKWTEEEKRRMSETQKWVRERERRRPRAAEQPTPSAVNMNCSVKVDLDQLARLSPAQVKAFMYGIGKVLAVSGNKP